MGYIADRIVILIVLLYIELYIRLISRKKEANMWLDILKSIGYLPYRLSRAPYNGTL